MLVIGYLLVLAFVTFTDGFPVRDLMLYPGTNHQGLTDFSSTTRNMIANQVLQARLNQQMQEYQQSDWQETHYMDLRKVI